LVALFFAFLWFGVIHHLESEWSFNPQYSYGWSVPLLMAYLLWRRWAGRPPVSAPNDRLVPIALIVLGGLLFLPLRFLSEANPDWRLLSWALATDAVAVSLSFVYLIGGRSWLIHFAFPIAFFFVAVPWPTHFEQTIIQGLMGLVSAINVAFVNAIGIPAVQHGNVIEVRTGLIGIEEACSGVRSLQATFMISLFLGELFSFRFALRTLLVGAGVFLAFACNLFRTALLVYVGATRGLQTAEGWHDPAGLSILLVCLAALWFIALALQRHVRHSDVQGLHPPEETATPLQFRRALFAGLAVWLVLVEGGVQAWYGFHQSAQAARWNMQWPADKIAYQRLPIPPAAEDLLRYDEGGGATWEGAENHHWMMFFFRWLPGRTAALFVKIHRPDICLPASGLTIQRDSGMRLVKVNGISLPVRSYRFEAHGTPLHVFYCYWDARSNYDNEKAANEEDWSVRGRVRAALRGRRENGAQMLELVVLGYENDAEAEAVLQQQLSEIIRSS
jgi:exosortase